MRPVRRHVSRAHGGAGAVRRAGAQRRRAADYPWAPTPDALRESLDEHRARLGRRRSALELAAPRAWPTTPRCASSSRPAMQRCGASPAMRRAGFAMIIEIDVRDVLPTIRVPDARPASRRRPRSSTVARGRYLAEHIPGAQLVELPGSDHLPWVGDAGRGRSTRSRSSSPASAARPSPTACWRPCCSPTSSARPSAPPSSATRAGASCSSAITTRVRARARALPRPRGQDDGDGFLATFDGPARADPLRAARSSSACAARPRGPRRPAHRRVRADRRRHRRHRRPHRRARRRARRRRRGARVEHGQGPGRGSGIEFDDRGAHAQGRPRRVAAVRGRWVTAVRPRAARRPARRRPAPRWAPQDGRGA